MPELISVIIGGGIGAIMRYLISFYAKKHLKRTCRATFFINIAGCLFLGILGTVFIKNPDILNQSTKLFLTIGIAGGFTTFSTFGHENISLIQEGKIFKSFMYSSTSIGFGLIATYTGFLIANFLI